MFIYISFLLPSPSHVVPRPLPQISGGALGDVRIWEMRSRELVSDLKEHVGAVTGIVSAMAMGIFVCAGALLLSL